MAGRYWLMKSEPGVFSFDDLKASPNATTYWEGVRNYQARNYMRADMKEKDLVLFYHSSCEKTGIPESLRSRKRPTRITPRGIRNPNTVIRSHLRTTRGG